MKGPIRVGIIGVHPDKGWASIAHIPALKQIPDYQLTTVSNHRMEVAQAAATKFRVPYAVASAADLVSHTEVDLVVVVVKVMRHRELVDAALGAGKAVLCEWPLGTDVEDAEAMRDIAATKGVRGFIGMQTRSAPVFNFVRALLREGRIGRVISSTLIGSGILWGDALPEEFAYTLDPANGVSMINVPFGHSVDAVLYALDSRFADLSARTATVRDTVSIIETREEVPMGIPDQVAAAGILESGAFLSVHFRGGTSRATNFHWEINGTKGDILVTSPVGYTGAGGFRIQSAIGSETLHDLPIPAEFDHGLAVGVTQSMALAYQRLASDLLTGTRLCPTFEDAVELHRLIDAIERKGHVDGNG